MIRSSLDHDAAHVILDLRPSGDIEFMTRPIVGALTKYLSGSAQSTPTWLRLVRLGDTVTGYVSHDGAAWTQVGSIRTWLPASAYVGLIVNSRDDVLLDTATFDSVEVVASGTIPVPPSSSGDIVIHASDIAPAALHGTWRTASDPLSPQGVKLTTPNQGAVQLLFPRAAPEHYVDVAFLAEGGKPYKLWLRLRARTDNKYNDSVWVQFSDALVEGLPAYRINSTSGLLVNMATAVAAGSPVGWGWVDGADWLSQPATVTFASDGMHTIRVQMREDGVEIDQIVLSPATYLTAAPGPPTNDATIVPK
jgi:hypothetical protein